MDSPIYKNYLGFNRCTVKRYYVIVLRCYNCQRIDHVAMACRKENVCARCAQIHNSADIYVFPCENEPCCKICLKCFLHRVGKLVDVDESVRDSAHDRYCRWLYVLNYLWDATNSEIFYFMLSISIYNVPFKNLNYSLNVLKFKLY